MKLKYMLESTELDDEIICVPIGTDSEKVGGVLRMNASSFEISQLLEQDTTEEAIVNALAAKYNTDRELLVGYVAKTVNVLRNCGMIED